MGGKAKFGIGDKVRIVNYGSILIETTRDAPVERFPIIKETKYWRYVDYQPELVGKIGLIREASGGQYALSGIKGKEAWYDAGQLEMINRNPNR
jgi:hypothetical protein